MTRSRSVTLGHALGVTELMPSRTTLLPLYNYKSLSNTLERVVIRKHAHVGPVLVYGPSQPRVSVTGPFTLFPATSTTELRSRKKRDQVPA